MYNQYSLPVKVAQAPPHLLPPPKKIKVKRWSGTMHFLLRSVAVATVCHMASYLRTIGKCGSTQYYPNVQNV